MTQNNTAWPKSRFARAFDDVLSAANGYDEYDFSDEVIEVKRRLTALARVIDEMRRISAKDSTPSGSWIGEFADEIDEALTGQLKECGV
jgi:sensor c-di-GMP phosphodiesterase-like protein